MYLSVVRRRFDCRDGEVGSESEPEGGDESSPAEESNRVDVSPAAAMLWPTRRQ